MKASQKIKFMAIKKYFTLIELSMVLLIIVLLASLIVSQGMPFVEQSTSLTILNRVKSIENAIKGNSNLKDYDGSLVPNGYINDMGAFPASLDDLTTKPNTAPVFSMHPIILNSVTIGHLGGGWQGPYLSANDFSNINNLITFDSSTDLDADTINDLKVTVDWVASDSALDVQDVEVKSTVYFAKRSVTISGIPASYLNANRVITLYYWSIEDGALKQSSLAINDPNTSLSGILTNNISSGYAAFYAKFEISNIITVLSVLSSEPNQNSLNIGDKILVSATGASGKFNNHENEIATKLSGNNYSFEAPSGKAVFVTNTGKTLIYHNGAWLEVSTKTSLLLKSLKKDITLVLE